MAYGFKTKKYTDAARKVFEAGYTVDDLAKAKPTLSRKAIQQEYDTWVKAKAEAKRTSPGGEIRPGVKTEGERPNTATEDFIQNNLPVNIRKAEKNAAKIMKPVQVAGEAVGNALEQGYRGSSVGVAVKGAAPELNEGIAGAARVAGQAAPYFMPPGALAAVPSLVMPTEETGELGAVEMVKGQAANAYDVGKKAVTGKLTASDIPAAAQAFIDVGALAVGGFHGAKALTRKGRPLTAAIAEESGLRSMIEEGRDFPDVVAKHQDVVAEIKEAQPAPAPQRVQKFAPAPALDEMAAKPKGEAVAAWEMSKAEWDTASTYRTRNVQPRSLVGTKSRRGMGSSAGEPATVGEKLGLTAGRSGNTISYAYYPENGQPVYVKVPAERTDLVNDPRKAFVEAAAAEGKIGKGIKDYPDLQAKYQPIDAAPAPQPSRIPLEQSTFDAIEAAKPEPVAVAEVPAPSRTLETIQAEHYELAKQLKVAERDLAAIPERVQQKDLKARNAQFKAATAEVERIRKEQRRLGKEADRLNADEPTVDAPPPAEAAGAKQAWEMTREEWMTRNPLPPQKSIPQTGYYTAIKTDDGNIHFGDDKVHRALIDRLNIPGERIVSGGQLVDGVYSENSADAAAVLERTSAGERSAHARSVRRAFSEGKPVPAEVLADYPDLAAKYQPDLAPTPAPGKPAEIAGGEVKPPVEGELGSVSLEDAYEAGKLKAPVNPGEEPRPYDKVIGGVAEVLRSQGRDVDWRHVNNNWHNPLAGIPDTYPVELVGKNMADVWRQTLDKADADLNRNVSDSGFAYTDGKDSAYLRSDLARAQKDADAAFETADRLEMQAADIEAMVPTSDLPAKARAIASKLRDRYESRLSRWREVVADAEHREQTAPLRRAESLQPVSTLSIRPSEWMGNLLAPGRFISDSHVLIDTQGGNAKKAAGLAARTWNGRTGDSKPLVAQSRSTEKVWKPAVAEATRPAVIAGYEPTTNTAYVVATDGSGYVTVNAHKLRQVEAITPYDSARLSPKDDRAVVLYKGAKPVAVVMPMRSSDVIDIPAALSKSQPPTKPTSAVSKLEAEIAERTNAAIPEAEAPTPGLTVKHVGSMPPRPPKTRTAKGAGYVSPDPSIERGFRETAGGLRKEGFIQHVKDGLTNLYHAATRTHEPMARNKQFARANEELRYIGHQRGVASNKTLRILQDTTMPLEDPQSFDVFRRKVVLDDFAAMAAKDERLPFGWTPDQITAELSRIDAEITSRPEVAEAIARRKRSAEAVKADYIAAMKDVGLDVSERLTREDYFRHQVLDYMEQQTIAGTGKKLKTPTGRGFLKGRQGSTKAISTNYLQAEWEVTSQMLHDTEVAKSLKRIQAEYDIATEVRADAKEQGLTDWHRAIPDDHTVWQPRDGNVFYRAKSVGEGVVDDLLGNIGIDPDSVRDVMAVGGKRKEWVIPKAVAESLDNVSGSRIQSARGTLNARLLNLWKQYVLLNPKRMIKYNLRNLSGDAEMAFVGNPSTFKEIVPATKELYQIYRTSRAPEGDLADWIQRGGQQGLLQAQEMGQVDQLGAFIRFAEKKPVGLKERGAAAISKYWQTARLTTDFREGILRYAAYKDYLRQITESADGKPKNFGASIPEEVMALKTPQERAYKLSNELLGAYDQVSELGRGLRSQAYPFWSWVEVNFGRNVRLMKNAVTEGQGAGVIARKGVAAVPKAALGGAKLIGKASFLWSALTAYNNLRFRDEENDLPSEIKARPHIILGRSKDGTVNYIGRLGAVADFLEWFGADAPQEAVTDFLNGRRSIKQIAVDTAKTPVNKVVQGLNPLWKTGGELISGKSYFPSIYKPARIRDKGEYLARQFSLDQEYRVLTGAPREPYGKSLAKSLADQANPDASAYWEIRDLKASFMEGLGKSSGGESNATPKSSALYNYKKAKTLGDKRAAAKYRAKYFQLGGTDKGLTQSIRTADPLYGLGDDKQAFLDSLNADEQDALDKAIRHYEKIKAGEQVPDTARSAQRERRTTQSTEKRTERRTN